MRALLGLAICLLATHSFARRDGIAVEDCTGCHSGASQPTVSVSTNPSTISPGDAVVVTVSISGAGSVGGMYLRSNGPGAFSLRSGQGTKLVSEDEVVHSSPKAASSGTVTFQVNWTAPMNPGGVLFDVWAVSANGNNSNSGDAASSASVQHVFGCEGVTYFRDWDADGVGNAASGTVVDCSVPAGYSAFDGDCNESNEFVFPGAPELCNAKDDDCDGDVDEGLALQTFYRDADGDGYGASESGTVQACSPPSGYVSDDSDCDDASRQVNPEKVELCNSIDDDCDGSIDESAGLVACGIGACMRTSSSCNVCTPGPRADEVCNGIDDDCDGLTDDDASGCEPGEQCVEGACVAQPEEAVDAGGPPKSPRPTPPAESGCATGGFALFPVLAMLVVLLRRKRVVAGPAPLMHLAWPRAASLSRWRRSDGSGGSEVRRFFGR